MRDLVDLVQIEAGFGQAVPNGEARELARVLPPVEPLLGDPGNDLPVHDQRRGGIVSLRDPVLSLVEIGPVRLLERDRAFEPADSYDLHGYHVQGQGSMMPSYNSEPPRPARLISQKSSCLEDGQLES